MNQFLPLLLRLTRFLGTFSRHFLPYSTPSWTVSLPSTWPSRLSTVYIVCSTLSHTVPNVSRDDSEKRNGWRSKGKEVRKRTERVVIYNFRLDLHSFRLGNGRKRIYSERRQTKCFTGLETLELVRELVTLRVRGMGFNLSMDGRGAKTFSYFVPMSDFHENSSWTCVLSQDHGNR